MRTAWPTIRTWLTGFAIFTIIATIFSIANYGLSVSANQPPQVRLLFTPFLYWYDCALVTPFLFSVVRRYPLTARHRAGNVMRYAAAVVAASAVHSAIYHPFHVLYPFDITPAHGLWYVLWLLIKAALYCSAILIVAVAIQHHRTARETRRRRADLETTLLRAQHSVLANQIKPHFLFNTLNAMAALSSRDKRATQNMALKLAEFLQLGSVAANLHTVTIADEIRLLEAYLAIMRMRFSDTLAATIDVPASIMAARLPRFLLQPLVENAIKYAARYDGTIGVRIVARREEDRLKIRVVDSGELPASHLPRGSGIGLDNLRKRMTYLYGARASLSIERRKDAAGVEVTVVVPYDESTSDVAV